MGHQTGSYGPFRVVASAVLAALLSGAGCAPTRGRDERTFDGLREAERSVGTRPTGMPEAALIVNGNSVFRSDLEQRLSEAAGGVVVEETALDLLLRDEMSRRDVVLTAEEVSAERSLLIGSLAAAAEGADAAQLLTELRRRRGLGPDRFQALLRRNAMLRRLIRDEVVVTDESIRQAFEVRHGPRARVRLIVVPTMSEAERVLRLARGDEDHPPGGFGELAAEYSTDISAGRGGLLEPISPADPSYPSAIRGVLRQLEPGQISPPISVDNGFAIIRLEDWLPATGRTLESERDALVAEVRARQERVLMDRKARELLSSAQITVLDAALKWSWEALREPGRP